MPLIQFNPTKWEHQKLKIKYRLQYERVLESMILCCKNAKWSNWAKTVEQATKYRFFPQCIRDVQSIILFAKRNKLQINMIGKGHSWSPLSKTGDILIDCRMLTDIQIDKQNLTATIQPGVSVEDLDKELATQDLCMLTNVVLTSVKYGGIIASGCHGAGTNNPPLSDIVVRFTVIKPDGTVAMVTAEDGDIMNAMKVSLGLLGFIYDMTLQVVPMHHLKMRDRIVPMKDLMGDNENLKDLLNGPMAELFWFPFMDLMWVKTWERTKELDTWNKKIKEKRHTREFCEAMFGTMWYKILQNELFTYTDKVLPLVTKRLGRNSTLVGPAPDMIHYRKYIERARCYNTEYAIKADPDFANIKYIWKQIVALVEEYEVSKKFPINLCLELRACRHSTSLLSPCNGKEGECFVYIEIISFLNTPGFQDASKRVSEIIMNYGGRPHWAKMYQVVPEPEMKKHIRNVWGESFKKFQKIREEFDPDDLFLNEHMAQLFKDDT